MGLYSKYCGSLWFISTGSCIVSWNVRSFGLSGCHQCHRFRRLWQCQSSTSKSRCSAKCRNCWLRFRIRSGNPIFALFFLKQNSILIAWPILPDLGNWICFLFLSFSQPGSAVPWKLLEASRLNGDKWSTCGSLECLASIPGWTG